MGAKAIVVVDREKVADRLRVKFVLQQGGDPLDWQQLTESERLRWLDLADEAVDAVVENLVPGSA